MQNKYYKYTAKELLDDEYFINSMIHPTSESDEFWSILLTENYIEFDEFDQARNFIIIMNTPKMILEHEIKNELWVSIEINNKKILRKSIKKKKLYLYATVASLLFAVFSMTHYILNSKTETTKTNTLMNSLLSVDNNIKNIQLTLSDKETLEMNEKTVDIVLEEDGKILANSELVNDSDNNKSNSEKKDDQMVYNQLFVPHGKHSSLTLPDGTKMRINSGTKVLFPNRFCEKEREIFVNGEVYLEVAKNEKQPFIVHTSKLDVKVLGTSFNINAYDNKDVCSVVLVSGSVNVYTGKNQFTFLMPEQRLEYIDGKSTVMNVNVDDYVSWKDGYYIFNSIDFKEILNQLSMYYGVKIICEQELISVKCSGKLDLKENLDKVMQDLSDFMHLQLIQENDNYKFIK